MYTCIYICSIYIHMSIHIESIIHIYTHTRTHALTHSRTRTRTSCRWTLRQERKTALECTQLVESVVAMVENSAVGTGRDVRIESRNEGDGVREEREGVERVQNGEWEGEEGEEKEGKSMYGGGGEERGSWVECATRGTVIGDTSEARESEKEERAKARWEKRILEEDKAKADQQKPFSWVLRLDKVIVRSHGVVRVSTSCPLPSLSLSNSRALHLACSLARPLSRVLSLLHTPSLARALIVACTLSCSFSCIFLRARAHFPFLFLSFQSLSPGMYDEPHPFFLGLIARPL